MTTTRNTSYITIVALSLALAACGGSDNDNGGAGLSSSKSIATITFENGETLSTPVFCVLESQMAAGQEILFTATSTSNPYFDATMFGPKSAFAGSGGVSWNETKDFKTYEAQWEASVFTKGFELKLEGKTITGEGMLIGGKDVTSTAGQKRQATLKVECAG